jgi:hypothetical protein
MHTNSDVLSQQREYVQREPQKDLLQYAVKFPGDLKSKKDTLKEVMAEVRNKLH